MLGLKGGFGRFIAGIVIKALEIDKVNVTQAKYAQDNATEFAKHILQEVGVTYEVPEEQLQRIPAEGGFITVSNHHFGSIDGLILCDTVSRIRPDYKLLTTFLLSLLPNLKEVFLPVDNLSGHQDARSVNGIRAALRHIADGGGIGFFPAGEVATYQKEGARTAICDKPVIEDKPWADNIIKLIKKSQLPVIPIFFDGTNSPSFHWLGKIHPRLRTVRLVHELFNKKGTLVKVRIGMPITPEETADMDLKTYGEYLRSCTYALEATCLPPEEKKECVESEKKPIAPQEDVELIRSEIASLEKYKLFENGDYACYMTPAADAPHLMREIARMREMIFRAVGEGTGEPMDTDVYDTYYRQLILWNIPNGEIAGAYRIGVGPELMVRPEREKAFYTASLFQFSEKMHPLLKKSLELGRTIVAPQYQRDVTSLKSLLTGIAHAACVLEGVQYFIGPVSISNDIPRFYKSLMVRYILKNYSFPGAEAYMKPTHPFQPDFLRVNPDHLLANCKKIDDLDKLIISISGGQYRMPVLLRKYISFGSRIHCFNIDPDFSDSLDGFIMEDYHDMPDNAFRTYTKYVPEDQLELFKRRINKS